MALTLGDLFQNWAKDTNLPTVGATVDGGVVSMLEPNLFRDRVMLPGITYATDVQSLMVDNQFAAAYIRKLDKIKVNLVKASADGAFRVVPTQGDGAFLLVECNDVLKVAEVVNEVIDAARVSGKTADRVAIASESYDEVRELVNLSYLINGGGSADATDVGAPASPRTTLSTPETILDNIIKDRSALLKAGAKPDTLLVSVDTDANFLSLIGKRTYFREPAPTEVAVLGQEFAGTLFSGKVKIFTTNSLGQDNSVLVGASAGSDDWDWSAIEYILYDHRTLCIINVARFIGLVDYSSHIHNSTLVSILSVSGGRIRNTQKAIAKKFNTPAIETDPAVLGFEVTNAGEDDLTDTSTIVLKTGSTIGSGTAITAEDDGTYLLPVGTYNYSVTLATYTTKTGTFSIIETQLGRAVTQKVTLVLAG